MSMNHYYHYLFLLVGFYSMFFGLCDAQPSGHGAYEVQSIEATQTNNQNAGSRTSSSKLKIVKPESGKASASVKVSGSNAKPESLPTWEGEGLKQPTIGKETVEWERDSNSSTEITVSGESSEQSIDIEISDPREKKFKADTKKFQPWLDKTNVFLKSVNETTANIAFTGELTLTTRDVDLYDDGENLGKYGSIGGTLTLQTGDKIKSPLIPWAVAGPIVLQIQFIADPIKLEVKADLALDESRSNPWGTSSTAEVSCSTGITGTAEIGAGVPASKAKGLVISGSVNANFGAKVKFKGEDKKILYKGEINVGKVQISGKLDFRLTEELTWTVASWGPKVCTEGFSEPVAEGTLYDFDQ